MTERSDFRFAGEVPEAYDRHLVAPLFEPMAHVLLAALALQPGEHLLDVACGPGSVARVAARHAGARGHVTGSDVSEEMVSIARSKAPQLGAAPIEYVVAGAAKLPFADRAFDAIACQQGLQFFPDKRAALSEMRRVLTPEGRAAVVVFRPPDGATFLIALRDAAYRAGVLDERAFERDPFDYGSADDLRADFAAAGFSDVSVGERAVPVVFSDGLDGAVAAIRGTPMWPPIAQGGSDAVAAFEREARAALAPLVENGAVRVDQYSNLVIARP